MMFRIGSSLLLIAYCVFVAWCSLALWLDGPSNRWFAGLLICGLGISISVILWKVRPFKRKAGVACGPVLMVLVWWLFIAPSNDRDWQTDVAQLASADISGSQVTIRNVRNFNYRTTTDYDENWETRTYDLDQVLGFDLFISKWGPKNIAHTIASWEFVDGQHLAVSIETRKEVGEDYSAVKGFFRQYEIYYVVADERDVVGLRAAHRGEQVFLYRLKNSPEQARAMLEDYLREINQLVESPEWYNALTGNCTTTIRHHAQAIGANSRWDWRILANGHLDEMGYERGMIDTSMPLEELRRASDISEKAKASIADEKFSTLIREGLPGSR